LGFVRDVLVASGFGATSKADIAVLLLTIPDFLVNILVSGGLSVALIPEFSRYGKGLRSQCLFLQSSFLVGVLFALVAIILINYSGELIGLFAPGLMPDTKETLNRLLKIVMWLIPLTTLAGVSTAYLQARGHFAVPAMGTMIFNFIVIISLVLIYLEKVGLQLLAVFIVLGGVIRYGSHVIVLPKIRVPFKCFTWCLITYGIVSRYFHAVVAGGILLTLPVIARAIASFNGEGSVAIFNYASRMVEFPLSVSVTVLSIGLFPLLASCFIKKENECHEMIETTLHIVIIIAISVSLPLIWYSQDIASLVFGWGQMQKSQTDTIGILLAIGMFALPFQGVSSVIVAIFNAKKDIKAMIPVNLIAVILFLTGGWIVGKRWGLSGLMLAIVITYILVSVLQIYILSKRHRINLMPILFNKKLVYSLFGMILIAFALIFIVNGIMKESVFVEVLKALLVFVAMLLVGVKSMGLYRWIAIK